MVEQRRIAGSNGKGIRPSIEGMCGRSQAGQSAGKSLSGCAVQHESRRGHCRNGAPAERVQPHRREIRCHRNSPLPLLTGKSRSGCRYPDFPCHAGQKRIQRHSRLFPGNDALGSLQHPPVGNGILKLAGHSAELAQRCNLLRYGMDRKAFGGMARPELAHGTEILGPHLLGSIRRDEQFRHGSLPDAVCIADRLQHARQPARKLAVQKRSAVRSVHTLLHLRG